jgi:hypothetical protein
MEATLRELFYSHTGRLIHKWDNYFEIYEKYFSRLRDKPVNMLEIGISHGGSLQLWKKYFGDKINIYAIDINDECKKFEEGNVKIFIGSQSDEKFLQEVFSQLPELDIVLDDGGHTMLQQIVSFENLFLKVKEGGIYMVEDTCTSYWHEFHGGLKKSGSFIEYSKDLIDSLYDGHLGENEKIRKDAITQMITGISFYDSIVVFEKKQRQAPFHLEIGNKMINPYVQKELRKKTLLMKIKQKFFGVVNNTFNENYKGHRKN